MDGTPRDVWHWLTTTAWFKLHMILYAPLDTPLSYWAHVTLAGLAWFVVVVTAMGFSLRAYDDWHSSQGTRQRVREKRKADSRDEYELAYWGFGWRKKRPRD